MLQKTKAVALSFIKYRETSIIVRFFTAKFGLQTYIVNGVRSKKARSKIALFQPLSLVDMVVYHNEKKEINRISEIRSSYVLRQIPYDIKKTSIALFLTELLGHILKEEGPNEPFFEYVNDALQEFDQMETNDENYHLFFMSRMIWYLGIMPQSLGEMLKEVGLNERCSEEFKSQIEHVLFQTEYIPISISKTNRNRILSVLIEYIRYHYDFMHELKSLPVLREVLS